MQDSGALTQGSASQPCTINAINTTLIALIVAAIALGAAALVSRGRVALLILAAGLFTVLTILALEINADWCKSMDAWVETWLDDHRSHRLRIDADGAFSYVGRPFHVAAAGAVAGALLSLQARSVIRGVLIMGGVGVGVIVEQTFKAVFRRTPETLAALHDGSQIWYQHSFPSGHVTGAGTLLGMIAVCLGVGRSPAVKKLLAAIVVIGVLFVACLALYSRAHIFSDVIGGMVLAGTILAVGAAVLTRSVREPVSAA